MIHFYARYVTRVLASVLATVLMTTCSGAATERPIRFLHAFDCQDRGQSSVCVDGKIARGASVTIIAKDWKAVAEAKDTFPNGELETASKTITRLEASGKPPAGAIMVAIVAPAGLIELIPETEVHDENVSREVVDYIRRMKNLDSLDRSGYKYEIKSRISKLSPAIMIAEANFTSHIETTDPRTNEKLVVGEHLDDDTVPLLIGHDVVDLFAEVRMPDTLFCGGIVTAFRLSGRMYVLSNASACESDAYSYVLVHDLSGKAPKLILK